MARPAVAPYHWALFTPGLDCRHFRKIGCKLVGRKVFNSQFDQANERTAEIRFRFAAAIDNHADRWPGQQRKGEFINSCAAKLSLRVSPPTGCRQSQEANFGCVALAVPQTYYLSAEDPASDHT